MVTATLDQLAEELQRCRMDGRSVSFLWGAGCSQSSGVPLADEWADNLKRRDRHTLRGKRSFSEVMEAYDGPERRSEIERMCKDAPVNAAHLSLAQLTLSGFVTCIMNVNFDPLVERAATLIGYDELSIYDLATTKLFESGMLRHPSLIYLHGRRAGFSHKMTRAETAEGEFASQLFNSLRQGTWIVIGYSGKNDELLDILLGQLQKNESEIAGKLYWLYRSLKDIPERLPATARQISISDADSAMIHLCRRMEGKLPLMLVDPRSHLKSTYAKAPRFQLSPRLDLSAYARTRIEALPETRRDEALRYVLQAEMKPDDLDNFFSNYSDVIRDDVSVYDLACHYAVEFLEYSIDEIREAFDQQSLEAEKLADLIARAADRLQAWPLPEAKHSEIQRALMDIQHRQALEHADPAQS